jgi:DNA-directed RNA polymerase specialized sigma24 family protein
MKNPFEGLLEPHHVRTISRRAHKSGFRGQDLDEVVQLTAIRLSRTQVREDAMLLAATDESAADVRRRESRHEGRVDRLQKLAMQEEIDSTDDATALAIDMRECVGRLSETDQSICEHLRRGRTVREIADCVGLSQSAVRFHMRRIRRHLTNCGLDEASE